MSLSPQLITLGHYLAGEFDNREQAIAEPIWYVHLRLWQRIVPLFLEDSITLFAEQANIVKLDQPYRQRIMRLRVSPEGDDSLQVQYYIPKNPDALRGAGRNPALLDHLSPDALDLLPGCILSVTQSIVTPKECKFIAAQPIGSLCRFTYLGNTIQVSLGFEVTAKQFLSYDKGIDVETGKATWGAVTGPYCYTKRLEY
jgi:hypothetical protein